MAFGDEKVVVDVKDVDKGELEYTDKEGKKHHYYPCSVISLFVDMLEVLTNLTEAKEGSDTPQIVTRIRGDAKLEDRGISVIGDPSSTASALRVTFEAGAPLPQRDKEEPRDFLESRVGGAMLGFNRANWEIRFDEDQWWLACYLPEAFIAAMVNDIRNAQITSVRFGIKLKGLYTSGHPYAPAGLRDDLFIRPNAKDNTIEFPELATGYVWSMTFTSAKVDMRQFQPTEDDTARGEVASPPADPVATAMAALSVRVGELRTTVKWVGGMIFIALLLLVLK